jgi:predicted NBD/HSP70 family sugar kinase
MNVNIKQHKIRKADPRIVRQINAWNVFEELRRRERTSIPELCSVIGLTAASVQSILHAMREMGLVKKMGEGKSAGGRKPSLYALETETHFILGAELGVSRLRVALVRLNGDIKDQRRFSLPPSQPAEAAKFLAQAVKGLVEANHVGEGAVLGLGVAQPGIVDNSGQVIRLDIHKKWSEVPLGELIQGELSFPVFLIEETHGQLTGIVEYGSVPGLENSIYILIGNIDAEGVSGAVMSNGALLAGHSGFAGEFGHMQVDPRGPDCMCGRRGCWEASGSLNRLAARIGLGLENEKERIPDRLFQDDCWELLDEFLEVHANGIVNLIHAFNPRTISVGGEITCLGDRFFQMLFERVRGKAMGPFLKGLSFVVNTGKDDALKGASAVAMKEVLRTFNIKGVTYG